MIVRREATIQIGGVLAASEPTVVRTLVGSCIAACPVDSGARVAGRNHFMLPSSANGHDGPLDRARFGVHIAKVFGGVHVLVSPEHAASVPQRNIRFIEEFMVAEAIPIAAWDVGGSLPRRLH